MWWEVGISRTASVKDGNSNLPFNLNLKRSFQVLVQVVAVIFVKEKLQPKGVFWIVSKVSPYGKKIHQFDFPFHPESISFYRSVI